MNSIRRPRRRPRARSVSFKTFGWLLVREAFLRIKLGNQAQWAPPWLLYDLVATPSNVLVKRAERILRLNAARRYSP